MNYVLLCLYGLIAGVLAKTLIPGKDEGGLISTTVLGIIGSISGGYLYTLMGYEVQKGISLSGLTPAVSGAAILLILWKFITYLKSK